MADKQFNFKIPEDAWEETGPPQDPRARLMIGPTRLTIAGMSMFLEAYAVREEEQTGFVSDVPEDADFDLNENIDAIYKLRGDDPPDPITIQGREYLLAAFPTG